MTGSPLPGGNRPSGTYADLGRPGREEIWRLIRALRHDPPGNATSDAKRQKVFGSALEQAEQLFRAAVEVAPTSRPILLFYGLSQAGRAVAASSKAAGTANWELRGHGIKATELDRPALHKVVIRNAGGGSFTQLASLLASGSLPSSVTLGSVWATIPDLGRHPLTSGAAAYKTFLHIRAIRDDGNQVVGWVGGLPWRFTTPYTESDIASYLDAYPTLAGSGPIAGDIVREEETHTARIQRTWPPQPDGMDAFVLRSTTAYRGDDDRQVFPALGGNTRPLHPLLAWWAVLFALSMLARYEPAAWTTHLSVDSSADAVPLETILDRALETCPELILHTIRSVAQ